MQRRPRNPEHKKWWYAAAVLAIVLVAMLIVGTDIRRWRQLPARRNAARVLPDTTLARWQANMVRRVRHLEGKYLSYRNRDRDYTEMQAALARAADSAFTLIYARLETFDEVETYRARIDEARLVKRMFSDLKKPVYRFARSIHIADSLRDADGPGGGPIP